MHFKSSLTSSSSWYSWTQYLKKRKIEVMVNSDDHNKQQHHQQKPCPLVKKAWHFDLKAKLIILLICATSLVLLPLILPPLPPPPFMFLLLPVGILIVLMFFAIFLSDVSEVFVLPQYQEFDKVV
ncbi:hypothetical protein ACHQM5_019192 [Ranunculus cassubicifolius]